MSGWTHRICAACFERIKRRPPVVCLEDEGLDDGICCACGAPAGGIFMRADPKSLKCEGKGPEHEDSEA